MSRRGLSCTTVTCLEPTPVGAVWPKDFPKEWPSPAWFAHSASLPLAGDAQPREQRSPGLLLHHPAAAAEAQRLQEPRQRLCQGERSRALAAERLAQQAHELLQGKNEKTKKKFPSSGGNVIRRHLRSIFLQKYPEKLYFEGLADQVNPPMQLQPQYLPIYFGNVCLRFLPVFDIIIHRFLELLPVAKSLETLLDHLGGLYKFHGGWMDGWSPAGNAPDCCLWHSMKYLCVLRRPSCHILVQHAPLLRAAPEGQSQPEEKAGAHHHVFTQSRLRPSAPFFPLSFSNTS